VRRRAADRQRGRCSRRHCSGWTPGLNRAVRPRWACRGHTRDIRALGHTMPASLGTAACAARAPGASRRCWTGSNRPLADCWATVAQRRALLPLWYVGYHLMPFEPRVAACAARPWEHRGDRCRSQTTPLWCRQLGHPLEPQRGQLGDLRAEDVGPEVVLHLVPLAFRCFERDARHQFDCFATQRALPAGETSLPHTVAGGAATVPANALLACRNSAP
jgi:hypothetical protein